MLSTELLGGTPASGKSDHDENLTTLKRAQVEAELLASLAQVLGVRVSSAYLKANLLASLAQVHKRLLAL
jgi:hypothetical protein